MRSATPSPQPVPPPPPPPDAGCDYPALVEALSEFPQFSCLLSADPSGGGGDPATLLRSSFRLGDPLCEVFNHLNPSAPLPVADVSPTAADAATDASCVESLSRFLDACRAEDIPGAADLDPAELYSDDPLGLAKLGRVVLALLARIESAGLMPPRAPLPSLVGAPPAAATDAAVAAESPSRPDDDVAARNRRRLVQEMIDTERAYLAAMEQLLDYSLVCARDSVLTPEAARAVFANLSDLVVFQRRFSIQMEAALSAAESEQRLGQLFVRSEAGFSVYSGFCSNVQRAMTTVRQEEDALMRLSHLIHPSQLQSYFIKPVQRVCKYPLLLQELIKLTESRVPHIDELRDGLAAIKRVAEKVNEEERLRDMEGVRQELIDRIDDWKNCDIEQIGALLLADKFFMRSGSREEAQEFHTFLFERTLLKGNIRLRNIDLVEDISRIPQNAFALRITWSEGVASIPFIMNGRSIDQIQLWKDRLERQ
ncbi:hypothetical protein HK405_012352, partial [Cladochytrium tenue]